MEYIILNRLHSLNNIGSLERTLEYYNHATPGEPLAGFSWGCMVRLLKGSFLKNLYCLERILNI